MVKSDICSSEELGHDKVLTIDSMNINIRNLQYAVKGPIVQKAGLIENELKKVLKNHLMLLLGLILEIAMPPVKNQILLLEEL